VASFDTGIDRILRLFELECDQGQDYSSSTDAFFMNSWEVYKIDESSICFTLCPYDNVWYDKCIIEYRFNRWLSSRSIFYIEQKWKSNNLRHNQFIHVRDETNWNMINRTRINVIHLPSSNRYFVMLSFMNNWIYVLRTRKSLYINRLTKQNTKICVDR
jgi:hypothetical protein